MSTDNPLWGAPRIHGELLKLGLEIAQSSVAKYMVKRSWPPSQGWRTFLRNHSSTQSALGVGCPHRNNGHSDNRARPGDWPDDYSWVGPRIRRSLARNGQVLENQ